jgi:hypothetical protein
MAPPELAAQEEALVSHVPPHLIPHKMAEALDKYAAMKDSGL